MQQVTNSDIYVAEVLWTLAAVFNQGQAPSRLVKNAVKLAKTRRTARGHY